MRRYSSASLFAGGRDGVVRLLQGEEQAPELFVGALVYPAQAGAVLEEEEAQALAVAHVLKAVVDLLGEEGGRVLLLAGAEVGVGPEALLLAGQPLPAGLVQLQGKADLEQLLPVLRRGLAAEPVGDVLPQGLGLLRPGGLPVYAQQPRFEPLRQPLAWAHGAQHVRKGAVERALLQKGDELRRAHAPAVYALQVAF